MPLHTILIKYSLIDTLSEAQRKVFELSSSSKIVAEKKSAWVKHTLHCFYASLQLLDIEASSVEFLSVPNNIHVDLIKDSFGKAKINDRTLNPEFVHREAPSCYAFEQGSVSQRVKDGVDDCEICDCGAKALFGAILAESGKKHDGKSEAFWQGTQSNLLKGLPRDVKVEPTSDDLLSGIISWDVNQLSRRLKGFEIIVQSGDSCLQLLVHRDGRKIPEQLAELEVGTLNANQQSVLLSTDGCLKHTELTELMAGKTYVVSVRQRGA